MRVTREEQQVNVSVLCSNEDPLLPQVNMRLKKCATVGYSQCHCDPSLLSCESVCARPSGFRIMLFSTLYFYNEFSPSSQHPASHNRGASPRVWVAQDSICRWHPFSCWHMGVFFLGKVCTGFCINWHCSENKIILFCITCMEVILCLRSDSGRVVRLPELVIKRLLVQTYC